MSRPSLYPGPSHGKKERTAEPGLALEDVAVAAVSICAALGAFWYMWKRFVK